MGEINNNNLNNLNFASGVQKPVIKETPEVEQTDAVKPQVEEKEINDLKNMPAATLGQSQVTADTLENDMKVLAKKPELVEKINAVIDEYAKDHTEEETLKFMDSAVQEFFAKK